MTFHQYINEIINFFYKYKFIIENNIIKFILVFLLYLIIIWLIYQYIIKKNYEKILNKIHLKKYLFEKFFKKASKWIKLFIILGGINISYYLSGIDFNKFAIFFKLVYVAEVITGMFIINNLIYILKNDLIQKFKSQNRKEELSLINLGYIIAKIITIGGSILISMNLLGINITPFLASAGLVGFAVAMASQEIIKNFIAGIILFIEKPFAVGDLIKLPDGRTAVVEEIGLRMTKFKTYLGDTIFIPNNKLLETIENVRGYLTDYRKIELEIGLPYGVDIEKAKQILKKILEQEEIIEKDSIEVFVGSLGDRSVNFKVRGNVPISKYDRKLPYKLTEKIYNEINKVGIGFPFPTYEILLQKQNN